MGKVLDAAIDKVKNLLTTKEVKIALCLASFSETSPQAKQLVKDVLATDNPTPDQINKLQLNKTLQAITTAGKCSDALMSFTPGIVNKVYKAYTKETGEDLRNVVNYIECRVSDKNTMDIVDGMTNGPISGSVRGDHNCIKERNSIKNGDQHNKLDSVIPTPDNGIQSTPGQASINQQDGSQLSRADILKSYMANSGNPILDKVMAQKIDRDLAQQQEKALNPSMQQTMQPAQPSL